jgi:PIN domain nuclease of toxin-antitoxin system
MDLLLDTHSYLWTMTDDIRLSTGARREIANSNNKLHLSVASLWGTTIKISKGTLELPIAHIDDVIFEMANFGVQLLGIAPSHLSALQVLPRLHRDPFDRLLIVQSQVEQMPLVTKDSKIVQYNVQTIW